MATTIILDQFTDPDGTNLIAHTIAPTNTPVTAWVVDAGLGAWHIESNAAIPVTYNAASQIANCDAGAVNYEFQADILVPAFVTFSSYAMAAGIVFKYVDKNNYWALIIKNLPSTFNQSNAYFLYLAVLNAGVETDYTIDTALSLAGTTQTIGVEVNGNVFTVIRNGVAYAPFTDTNNYHAAATKAGTFNFANGPSLGVQFTYGVAIDNFNVFIPTIVISPSSLPAGKVGTAYSQTITAFGGSGVLTLALTSGGLPPGITFVPATGVISGTPTVSGSSTFTITATDTLSNTGTQTYTLVIGAGGGGPILLRPDPLQTAPTRQFQQKVAHLLNPLLQSGAISPTGIAASVSIGTPVGGSVANSVLYINASGQIGEDPPNFTYTPASGLVVNGVITAGGVTVGNIGLTTLFVLLQTTNLATVPYNVGFFEALNDPANDGTGYIQWDNEQSSLGFPGHVFTASVGTPTSTVGIVAGSSTNILQGQSTIAGGTIFFSFSAAGNLSCGTVACGTETITSTSASALAVGANGATNPVLQVDASAATVKTGVKITGAAANAGVTIAAISSATNEAVTLSGKGTGNIIVGPSSLAGIIVSGVSGMVTITSLGLSPLQFFANTSTNAIFTVTTSGLAPNVGLLVTGFANSTTGLLLQATSSAATNEHFVIASKGTGQIKLNTNIGTGNVVVGNGLKVSGNVGFYGTTPVAQQTGDVATALVTYGLLTAPTYGGTLVGSQALGYVATDQATTSSAMANVTSMSFAIPANQVWSVEFNLLVTGGALSTGTNLQLTGPAAPTLVTIFTQGDTTGVGVVSSDQQSAFSTPTQAYVAGGFTGVITMKALLSNGANAGTIALQFASNTNTQTNTIKAGSYFTARRIA